MLSKMKTSAQETRSSVSRTSHASDTEDNETIDNDTNNNNNSNINNNQQTKKTQDELLDIVEVSRKRRLSKDSADSLTSFIRWSFTHVDHPNLQRLAEQYSVVKSENLDVEELDDRQLEEEEEENEEDELDGLNEDDAEDWHHNQPSDFSAAGNRFKMQEQLLRQAKLNGSSTSASNLALMKNQTERHLSLGNLLSESARGAKRRHYSPERESKFAHHQPSGRLSGSGAGGRKSSPSYLGNVVERLHQQQQKQQQQQQQLQQQEPVQSQQQHQEPAEEAQANVSFHLQQFLQQQTSLEDLCSSVGLEDGNQLVLAAAIHRALVDSVGSANQLNQVDSKSTASSTGSSSGGSSSTHVNNTLNQLNNPLSAGAAAAANLHLVESMNRQRRAYNTRAALHGLGATVNHRQTALNQINNRMQQQRHAQAAAALSALSSAGSHHHSALHHLPTAHTPTTPLVDFKCDTCPSSFDDRHRLMQHQSIHLELKKDWFTETPVDEVMKIFNRRRGEFLCNICNLRFEATLDYDQHNHTVHGPRPYCCQFCGNGTRTFKCWRQYLNHLYDHRYIFSCTIDNCDFTVNRRDSLRFHIFRFHLNCQLPQNQQQQLRGSLMMGNGNPKWPTMNDDEDTENEMNVAD